jgi:hypothetical protein
MYFDEGTPTHIASYGRTSGSKRFTALTESLIKATLLGSVIPGLKLILVAGKTFS